MKEGGKSRREACNHWGEKSGRKRNCSCVCHNVMSHRDRLHSVMKPVTAVTACVMQLFFVPTCLLGKSSKKALPFNFLLTHLSSGVDHFFSSFPLTPSCPISLCLGQFCFPLLGTPASAHTGLLCHNLASQHHWSRSIFPTTIPQLSPASPNRFVQPSFNGHAPLVSNSTSFSLCPPVIASCLCILPLSIPSPRGPNLGPSSILVHHSSKGT
jgi:hypothetical protein